MGIILPRDMKAGELKSSTIRTLVEILKKYGAVRIAIFGSSARNERKKGSDIDILVDLSGRKSLFDLIRIEMELEETLGTEVDMLTRNSISPYLIGGIEKEAVVVYG